VPISDQNGQILLKFWKSERAKIHDAVRQNSSWNNHLVKTSWRVDMKTKSNSVDEIQEPCGIVEMRLASTLKKPSVDVFQFEIDRTQLASVMTEIQAIQARLAQLAG